MVKKRLIVKTLSWLTNIIPPRIREFVRKKEVPEHLWSKCEKCSQMLLRKDLEKFLFVCPHCQHHMRWPVGERLKALFDEAGYQAISIPKIQDDPLNFKDRKRYTDRLKEGRQELGIYDAITLSLGKVQGHLVVVACFDFQFIGGSMGLAVGETLVKGAELAVSQDVPYLVYSASGGARMQEGMLSLMQMPRSSLAILKVKEQGLPFISFLTHPTTGGVAASFASLGDITLAEPGAVVGFTGARVIEQILRKPLPEGFQEAEFQKSHGFIDLIVHRKQMKNMLGNILALFKKTQKN